MYHVVLCCAVVTKLRYHFHGHVDVLRGYSMLDQLAGNGLHWAHNAVVSICTHIRLGRPVIVRAVEPAQRILLNDLLEVVIPIHGAHRVFEVLPVNRPQASTDARRGDIS